MDFTLTEEQRLLRDGARSLLTGRWTPDVRRTSLSDAAVADKVWSDLREWTALADGPLTDLCLFLAEAGAVLAPGPFYATTGLFVPFARAAGLVSLADQAAAGELTGTVAVADADGRWQPHPGMHKGFVLDADRVDALLVVDRSDAGLSVRVVVDAAVDVLSTMDLTRRTAAVETADARTVEGPVPLTEEAFGSALERATVALAAELAGTTRTMFEDTVAYAKSREQFGRPIGSFQALQHRLADMMLAYERAWSAVAYAAMTLDATDPDRHRAVHVAKAAVGDAAVHVAREAMQMHGGIGFTWEHDLHLYLRRAYGDEQLMGSTEEHRDRLADLVFADGAALTD
jgi:alkylation response protein AidB-like acyl-CoA dehydrogenase